MAANKVALQIHYSDEYLLQMIRTWLRFRQGARRERVLKVFLGVVLAAFFIMCAIVSVAIIGVTIWVSIFLVLLCITPFLLVYSRRLDEWNMIRGMQKSPGYRLNYRVEISDAGYSEWSEQTSSTLSWEMFTSALQVVDGILLFQGRDVFHWLPYSALVHGTPEDSTSIISRHVGQYEIR